MRGQYARRGSRHLHCALANTTLPYGLMIANQGLEAACRQSCHLAAGVNIYRGACTCENVAVSLDIPYTPLDQLL